MMISLSRDRYSVGLIAILKFEVAAVRAIFDEEHGKPFDFYQNPFDDNTYYWGRIGKHNAVLVESEGAAVYGLAHAATMTRAMVMAISSLRIGLLIGIGGGIPNLDKGRDIRLGDVAVSQPMGGNAGVVQYDFGKQGPTGFERIGRLERAPPGVLLEAVTVLRASHFGGSSGIARVLAELQRRMGGFGSDFVYQDRDNDRLFIASFRHQGGDDCTGCRDRGVQYLVDRLPRLSDDPVVHHGLIASGNRVIKDAESRDDIAFSLEEGGDGNCICYEMEAAGLMDDLPCLVIRGISDYADSHKNDRWQKYAALTAAAYAKGLLEVVPLV